MSTKQEDGVVEMTPNPGEFTLEEQEILKQAEDVQKKRLERLQKEQDAVLLELQKKFGLGKVLIEAALEVEKSLSNPETGINTVLGGMQYYKDSKMTTSQIMFLAVTANSRANQLQVVLSQYGQQVEKLTEELEALQQRVAAEDTAKTSMLEEGVMEIDFPKE